MFYFITVGLLSGEVKRYWWTEHEELPCQVVCDNLWEHTLAHRNDVLFIIVE